MSTKVDAGDLEKLKQHIWDFCRRKNIFITVAENVNSSCVSIPCRDFEGRLHYTPINVLLNKGNKKLTNVIFLSHEAGHFLDTIDNPKGWEECDDHCTRVFDCGDDGFVHYISAERYEREKEAWRRGFKILDSSGYFSDPIRKKFFYWKEKAMGDYTEGYEKSCELLAEGKEPISLEEAKALTKKREKAEEKREAKRDAEARKAESSTNKKKKRLVKKKKTVIKRPSPREPSLAEKIVSLFLPW